MKTITFKDLGQQDYIRTWTRLHEKMIERGFTWTTLFENDEWNQYMSPDVLMMDKSDADRLREDTVIVGKLIQSTYNIIMNNFNYLMKLKLPKETLNAVTTNINTNRFSDFARFDIIKTDEGNKFIEINSDTPTGYLETSVGNEILCENIGIISSNKIEENIQRTWDEIIARDEISSDKTIFFTSYKDHDEDRDTVQFIRKNCNHPKTEYIGIEDIMVGNGGLFTPDGRTIKHLFRLYPMEYLPHDVDSRGKKIGEMFLRHIANGTVKVYNNPSAFVTQSKLLFAVMWEILLDNPYLYETHEREAIKKYIPMTLFKPDYFINNKRAYVEKPIYGREGGGVTIRNGDNKIVDEDTTPEYYEQVKVYQEYFEMPNLEISTWDDRPYMGKMLIGSYLIGGEASGLFIRVGDKITGNLSMVIGIAEI